MTTASRPSTLRSSIFSTSPSISTGISSRSTGGAAISSVSSTRLLPDLGVANRFGPVQLFMGPNYNRRTKDRLDFSAISPSGATVAMVAKQKFWVYEVEKSTLLCTGVFDGKKPFMYSAGKHVPAVQIPLPDKFPTSSICSMALCDDYLAIGAKGKVMIFAVSGNDSGRWIGCDNIPHCRVTKLAFSATGSQLVAVLDSGNKDVYEAARIYSTNKFTIAQGKDFRHPGMIGKEILAPAEVRWERGYAHSLSAVAWSQNGGMVAICSNLDSMANSRIRILKKEASTWRSWGITEVHGHMAGISL